MAAAWSQRDRWVAAATAALTVALLILDLQMPLGVAVGALYSLVTLLALRSSRRWFPFVVAGTCTFLTVVGGMFGPTVPGFPIWMAVSNRALSLVLIWVPLLFFLQHQRAQAALRRAYGELEVLVQERTRDLAKVNRALVEEISERMEAEQNLRKSTDALQESQRALHDSREELRGLAARLLTAQEEDRRRLSRDLHDDINQRLAMLAVELETLERQLPSSPGLIGPGLRSLVDRVVGLSEDVRHLAYQFHPSILDDLGLPIALQRLVDDFSAHAGVRGRFSGRARTESYPSDIAGCLYRVAQESLGNVARHAKASLVEVELTDEDRGLALSVRDNGIGFDPVRTNDGGRGLGLVSMKERLHLVQGTLEVRSAPGQGTAVRAWVPLSGRTT
jgi:signal transduction histidine kinase